MEWIILFAISWILFILLIDWKRIKINIWSGILAVGMQLAIDSQAMSHALYRINNQVLQVLGSSFFFAFGPVLAVGILFAQFHPVKRWMRIVNILVVPGLLFAEESLLISRKVLVYTDWRSIDSMVVNIAAIIILSWFSIVVLNKKGRSGKWG